MHIPYIVTAKPESLMPRKYGTAPFIQISTSRDVLSASPRGLHCARLALRDQWFGRLSRVVMQVILGLSGCIPPASRSPCCAPSRSCLRHQPPSFGGHDSFGQGLPLVSCSAIQCATISTTKIIVLALGNVAVEIYLNSAAQVSAPGFSAGVYSARQLYAPMTPRKLDIRIDTVAVLPPSSTTLTTIEVFLSLG